MSAESFARAVINALREQPREPAIQLLADIIRGAERRGARWGGPS